MVNSSFQSTFFQCRNRKFFNSGVDNPPYKGYRLIFNQVFSPQATRGVVEDIRVYVVVSAVVGPAGEWHNHVLSQGGQCGRCKFFLQLVGGRQVP